MSDRSFSALSQRAFDLQKPPPSPNEWASKIQAMKQQVEGTEEDDHKRLEEEIAAARQARLRRSLGAGTGGSRSQTHSVPEQSRIASGSEGNTENDVPKSDLDRQSHQDTALQKLMGRNNIYNPDKLTASGNSSDRASLASFIGGSASGPRLNKHAPQPNAHDPTQFIQPDTNAPHPVFGRNGIAMPGLATKKSFGSIDSGNKSDYAERYHGATTSTTSNEPLKSPGHTSSDTPRGNADIKRRSYSATPKSPSPALAARYAEKFEQPSKSVTPIRSQTLQASQPVPALTQRKSFSSLPASSAKTDVPNSLYTKDTQAPRSFSGNPTSSKHLAASTPTAVPDPAVPLESDTTLTRPSLTETRSLPATSQISVVKPLDFAKKTNTTPVASESRAFSAYTAPPFSSKTTEPAKDTSLKRLMETNSVYNPDKKQDPHKALEQVPLSLAAFIGGSAKGPRLNKHAPQPDAHDPTQFIQPDLTAPHPIFGRGGVAMPGMATKKAPSLEEGPSEISRPSNVKSRWPPVTAPPGSRGETRSVSPHKAGNRERTTSTPSVPQFSNVTQGSNTSYISHVQSSRSISPSKERERTLSTPSYSQYLPSRTSASPVPPIPATATPSYSQYLPSRTSASPAPQSQATTTPSYLARPVVPDPKPPAFTPQIPPAVVPSPAFQKSPLPKDPTPSISRLKGRGFVQNMVKASVHLESVPTSTPLSTTKPRPVSAGKGSVLDRWQAGGLASPTKSSPSSDPVASRPVSDYQPDYKFSDPYQPPKSLRSSASVVSVPRTDKAWIPQPSVEEPLQRTRTPGVGSGTTMVLIKPSKSNTDLRQASLVDELGVQLHSSRLEPNPPNIQSTPKKPLIHANDVIQPIDRPKVEAEGKTRDNGPAAIPGVQVTKGLNPLRDQKPSIDKENFPEPTVLHNRASKLALKGDVKSPQVTPLQPDQPQLAVSPQSPPSSPHVTKHTRIPSTGNRATVMEMAMVMANNRENKPQEVTSLEPTPHSPITSTPRPTLPPVQSEKRRSTYEKYSSIMLPPLKEEVTPTPSPAGTIGRSNLSIQPVAFDELIVVENQPLSTELVQPLHEQENVELLPQQAPEESQVRQLVTLGYKEEALPDVNLSQLHPVERSLKVPAENQTISVDILSIIANATQPVAKNFHIFYETEVLAIVHRSKSPESGLVSTVVWCWLGKRCQFKDREDKKLRELATRYGTSPVMVHQLSEPVELVNVLGGQLITRQGTRSHWSAENTTMHLVRSQDGVVLIDEHDFNVKNLCSAFSYCFTILGTVYVWHGSGSVASEQEAALAYARTLDEHMTPVEMVEGTTDQDEIFWMMLGDDAFAQADYWKFRKLTTPREPSIWRLDGSNDTRPIHPVEFISSEQYTSRSVYIIDCIWELFVVVGKDARGDRRSIRLALDVAMKLSRRAADHCPFPPTVHALIMPSKLPLDLMSNIRDLDEIWLNNGDIPDHMNVVPCNEALEHLTRREWDKSLLKDPDMLPLGVALSDLL